MAGKKKGLGKGLDALLGGINTQMNDAAESPISTDKFATDAGNAPGPDAVQDRKSTRLNSSHPSRSRMPSSA